MLHGIQSSALLSSPQMSSAADQLRRLYGVVGGFRWSPQPFSLQQAPTFCPHHRAQMEEELMAAQLLADRSYLLAADFQA